jgi:hypothetical protein
VVQLWLLRASAWRGAFIDCSSPGIRPGLRCHCGLVQSHDDEHGILSEPESTPRIWGQHRRRKDGVFDAPHRRERRSQQEHFLSQAGQHRSSSGRRRSVCWCSSSSSTEYSFDLTAADTSPATCLPPRSHMYLRNVYTSSKTRRVPILPSKARPRYAFSPFDGLRSHPSVEAV